MPLYKITEHRTVIETYMVEADSEEDAESKFLDSETGCTHVDTEILNSCSLRVELN